MPAKQLSKHIQSLADHTHLDFYQRPSLKPFTFISKQATLDFGDKGQYIVVIYGAYDAMGLIGTEKNGIGVLDHTNKRVLLDEHQMTNSGYFTPTERQTRSFDELVSSDWEAFRNFVNNHDRTRYHI